MIEDLNQEQRVAVVSGDGPALVLAGAGSGKTRVLTYRAAYLIKEKKIDPSRILLLTFTNQAGKEMKERIKKLVGDGDVPWAGTFHSWCAQVLRKDGKHIGIDPGYLIYDDNDSQMAVKQVIEKLKLSAREFKPRSALNAISAAKNELIGPLEYPQYAKGYWYERVAEMYLAYQKLLKESR